MVIKLNVKLNHFLRAIIGLLGAGIVVGVILLCAFVEIGGEPFGKWLLVFALLAVAAGLLGWFIWQIGGFIMEVLGMDRWLR